MYQPRFEVVSWDDVWGGGSSDQRPSVDAQIHLVRNRSGLAQCPMPNAQCPMPNAQRPTPNAQCPMPIAQYPMPIAHCPIMPDAHQCPPMPNSARIISPHGTFTSVWSLFLRPGAIVYELTASCYLYTWLPVPYLTRGRLWQPVPHLKKPSTQLSLRHVYLSWRLSDEAKARQTGIQRKAGNWSGPLLELVHPKTGSSSSSSSVYHIPDPEHVAYRLVRTLV